MKKLFLMVVLSGICLAVKPAGAADSLAAWAQDIEKPETQQLILNRIFNGQIGSLSEAVFNKEAGTYLFTRGGSWLRLGRDVIYVSSTSTGGPYLIVSCMSYNRLGQDPMGATSYLFYDTAQKPAPISGGYAKWESVHSANLPKLNHWFLVLVDTSGNNKSRQSSGFVLALEGTDKPRAVWNSPMAVWNFQFGFDTLGGTAEELVFKTTKGDEVKYSAYRWNGNRFELDSFASENRLKALPDSVWQYGSVN